MDQYMRLLRSGSTDEDIALAFMLIRREIKRKDKDIAALLGITPRAMTERVTGRAQVKRETCLAMLWILKHEYLREKV